MCYLVNVLNHFICKKLLRIYEFAQQCKISKSIPAGEDVEA